MRTVTAIRNFMGIALLLLTSFVVLGAASDKSALEAMYDKAFRAFDAGNYEESLKALDAVDKRQSGLAESLNLRGVVYMRQKQYDKAEAALRKAVSVEPKFWNARFNLAEIPFLKKDWQEARNRFEALITGENQNLRPETGQLIQYKILLTFVLQGKENMVGRIMNKFESAKDSPALYYSNAALAFEHDNKNEADEWLTAATKHFSEPLNKLYAESFYEIGWVQKPAGETRAAIEITSTTERAERLKSDAAANFEKAEQAFEQQDFDGALKFLDLAEADVPGEAQYDNLRGEILMKQGKFDEAEVVLQKAFTADPKFREAQYNLAQIPFKKGEYAKARDRFEALFEETPGDVKNQASQLIKYKIFLTLLLDGKDNEAQPLMDQFKFTGDTPALYYAHAAWEFKQGHEDEGNDWVNSARKIYSAPINVVFADSFYDLGWLKKTGVEIPSTVVVAQADASPAGPTPAMQLGQSDSLTVSGSSAPTESLASAASATPAENPIAAPLASPATPDVNPTPAVAIAPAQAVATAAPEQSIPEVRPTESPPKTAAAKSVTPKSATAVALPQSQDDSSIFAGISDRIFRPIPLLAGGVLLAGILFLVSLVVRQARRDLATDSTYESPASPPSGPVFGGAEDAQARNDPKASCDLISTGPPKLSVGLQGSESSSVRGTSLPANSRGLAGAANGQLPSPNEAVKTEIPTSQTPDAAAQSIVPPILPPMPATAKVPVPSEKESGIERVSPRNKEEVSLPAIAEAKTAGPTEVEASSVEIDSIAPAIAEPSKSETTNKQAKLQVGATEALISEPLGTEVKKAEVEPERLETAKAEALETLAQGPELKTAEREPKRDFLSLREEEEAVFAVEEPIGQGAPVPELTTLRAGELPISELAQPEPESPLELIEPEKGVAAPIAIRRPVYSPIETSSFASKIISTEPFGLQPTTPVIMPETTITPAPVPAMSPASSTVSVQQLVGGMHTTVQLTFSLEIASMQLTPTLKMSGLQLKPISRVVSMRLASSQDPQPPMNLQVTFEVAKIELTNGAISTVRLLPSIEQKPAVLTSSSFSITGLELVNQGVAPVQLTPSHQEQASVHLTAEFQVATIEFTPLFEIAAIVLNSTSKKVLMQLPGSGPSSIDNAPLFEIEDVQLAGSNEISLIQVAPGAVSAPDARRGCVG